MNSNEAFFLARLTLHELLLENLFATVIGNGQNQEELLEGFKGKLMRQVGRTTFPEAIEDEDIQAVMEQLQEQTEAFARKVERRARESKALGE